MTYPMSDEDRAIQERARRFVDEELIPYEVDAEMNQGVLPPAVIERQEARLRELGQSAVNMPKELGGDGLSVFQQVLVSEQIGRATNALGWVLHNGPQWAVEIFTDEQVERYLKPFIHSEPRGITTRSPSPAPAPTWTPSRPPPAGTATRTS